MKKLWKQDRDQGKQVREWKQVKDEAHTYNIRNK